MSLLNCARLRLLQQRPHSIQRVRRSASGKGVSSALTTWRPEFPSATGRTKPGGLLNHELGAVDGPTRGWMEATAAAAEVRLQAAGISLTSAS